jgi:hypothetical protein
VRYARVESPYWLRARPAIGPEASDGIIHSVMRPFQQITLKNTKDIAAMRAAGRLVAE